MSEEGAQGMERSVVGGRAQIFLFVGCHFRETGPRNKECSMCLLPGSYPSQAWPRLPSTPSNCTSHASKMGTASPRACLGCPGFRRTRLKPVQSRAAGALSSNPSTAAVGSAGTCSLASSCCHSPLLLSHSSPPNRVVPSLDILALVATCRCRRAAQTSCPRWDTTGRC
jgi:hypothetical protein